MCTVSYIPTEEGFVFTSSRDERYNRSATEFPIEEAGLTFPRDLEAKGTWIASSQTELRCLLNGGFKYHESQPPYKKSRGIMLLESFTYGSINDFVNVYDFEGMEPFTFICIESHFVHEIRWDFEKIFHIKKSLKEKHIWSSSTLYTPESIAERKTWFDDWFKDKTVDIDFCRTFHYNGGSHDAYNSVLLKRDLKGTISITSVTQDKSLRQMIYDDFENGIRKVSLEKNQQNF